MTIRELEQKSGLERANIRFYEKEKLLNPVRRENGYRDYSEEDLQTLRRICLFRRLQFSLEEIRSLQEGKEELSEALTIQLQRLERREWETERAREVCRSMQRDRAEFEGLDAENIWLSWRSLCGRQMWKSGVLTIRRGKARCGI